MDDDDDDDDDDRDDDNNAYDDHTSHKVLNHSIPLIAERISKFKKNWLASKFKSL
jgi:hypothetical protein